MFYKNKGNYWPTTEQDYLLKVALLSEKNTVFDAWTCWRSTADIDHLDLGSFNLLPLVCHNLNLHGIQDDLTGKLQGIKRRAWYKNQILFHAIMPVIHALQKVGIKVMLLKGAALFAKGYYTSLALRPMSDIDILVPAADAIMAIDVAIKQGWTFKNSMQFSRYRTVDPDFLRYCSKGVEFKHPSGYEFDLHWQIPLGGQPMAEDFWRRAEPIEFQGIQTWTLNDADQLLHICTHGLAWNAIPPFRWVADAMAILNHSDTINWDELLRCTQQSHLVLPLRLGLGYLQKLLNPPIDLVMLKKLQQSPISFFECFYYWGRTDHRQFPRIFLTTLALHQANYHDYVHSKSLTSEPEAVKLNPLYFLQKIWGLENWRQVLFYAFSRLLHYSLFKLEMLNLFRDKRSIFSRDRSAPRVRPSSSSKHP